jgi:UDP-N-acetylmuramate dehydrogenase
MFKIKFDASFLLADIVGQMMDIGFAGFEWAAGIPGTLGGAINGNAGAFGESISDNVLEIDALRVMDGIIEKIVLKKSDCGFAYRSSIFKASQGLIILSATFVLKKQDRIAINEKVSSIFKKRLGKHPKGYSAGSVFKNYEGELNKKLFKKYPELQEFSEKGMTPIGYLIERCGLKGTRIGDAQISPDHGNFIINLEGAKSDNVLKLISLIKRGVKEKFEIDIREEIKYLG